MSYFYVSLFMVLSYLFGSIPFGLIIGKLFKGIDIRQHGSKNIGSTNAIRVLGKKVGFVVFFFDVFKGALPVLIALILKLTNVFYVIDPFYYGVPAILGHTFSIYLKFKGGKAVATSLGVALVASPTPALACLVGFAILLYSTGYVCLASTAATLTLLTTGWILFFFGIPSPSNFFEYLIIANDLPTMIIYSFFGLLIILRHIKNYKRIIEGTENNFKKKKKEKEVE